MKTPVIIMGANGRMGATLVALAQKLEGLNLAGVVERAEHLAALHSCPCTCGETLESVSDQAKAVVIDFTAPAASLATAEAAVSLGHPLVIGTTGFSDAEKTHLQELARKTPIFWSPNMSVGINVLLEVLPDLVRKLDEAYDIDMVEMHHNRKKDAPSGTALLLADCLAQARNWNLKDVACYHREGMIGERPHEEIGVQTIRGGDIVGVHTMYFMGPGERIEVSHHAHSRETFAHGALRAAQWLYRQPAARLYSMGDMLA